MVYQVGEHTGYFMGGPRDGDRRTLPDGIHDDGTPPTTVSMMAEDGTVSTYLRRRAASPMGVWEYRYVPSESGMTP